MTLAAAQPTPCRLATNLTVNDVVALGTIPNRYLALETCCPTKSSTLYTVEASATGYRAIFEIPASTTLYYARAHECELNSVSGETICLSSPEAEWGLADGSPLPEPGLGASILFGLVVMAILYAGQRSAARWR